MVSIFRNKTKILVIAAFFCGALPTFAAKIGGIEFADTDSSLANPLVLNGVGERKYMWARVYVAGLYVPTKTKDPAALLDMPGLKMMRLHYFHDVKGEDSKKVWKKSWADNCKPDLCKGLEAPFQKFVDGLQDTKKNTEETYVFDDKYFELKIGESVRRIEGAGFAKALLRNWIGPKPPTESLKTGLLGTK